MVLYAGTIVVVARGPESRLTSALMALRHDFSHEPRALQCGVPIYSRHDHSRRFGVCIAMVSACKERSVD